jgi:SNF2 family DNA or RNA helicase
MRHGLPPVEVANENLDTLSFPESAREYQRGGVQWLVRQLKRDGGALLADDMGLGKTMQTIAAWANLGCPDLLIVCPASVRRTWVAQFARWAPGTHVRLLEPGRKKTAMPTEKVVEGAMVTSYEMAAKLLDSGHFKPSMIVFDEVHKLRSRVAKMSLYFRQWNHVRYKLALTGTPMWSYPRDFWNILRTLFGYRFGNADQFDEAYCGLKYNKWGGKENKGRTRGHELAERLRWVMLRRTKADVKAELPSMTRVFQYVEPTKDGSTMMRRFALKQASFADAVAVTLLSKYDAAVEAAMQSENALVVTWRKIDVAAIAEKLEKERGKEVITITGEDSHAERERKIGFASRTRQDVVVTIDSVGTGVDGLQMVTSYGVFHALDYTPIKTLQCEARLHRGGQALPVTWTYILAKDSVDEFVKTTVLDKLDHWAALMGKDDSATYYDGLKQADAQDEEAALAEMYAAIAAMSDFGGSDE